MYKLKTTLNLWIPLAQAIMWQPPTRKHNSEARVRIPQPWDDRSSPEFPLFLFTWLEISVINSSRAFNGLLNCCNKTDN